MSTSQWHIARVSPGKEKEASNAPALAPFVSYYPVRTVPRFNRRHRVWRRFPEVMYPGYVFVSLPEDHIPSLLPCSNLHGFLRRPEGGYYSLSEEGMALMRKIAKEEAAERPTHSFVVGDKVLVNKGLSGQMEAIVMALDGKDALLLDTVILGAHRDLRVEAARVGAA